MNASDNQLARVRALIAEETPGHEAAPGAVGGLRRLCRALVRALPASGAGVSVMTGHETQGLAAASDAVSSLIEELQFTLGEGPCLDAHASRRPVLASDLSGEPATRWPAYSAAAQGLGVRAVFAFPLQIGAARLGVLDVYRHEPGALTGPALALALTFAEVALLTLLDGQERARPGETASDLDEALHHRVEVYQAQGMVQMQLGVSSGEAMVRLRSYAYAHDRRLTDVARDIVARTLLLERDDR